MLQVGQQIQICKSLAFRTVRMRNIWKILNSEWQSVAIKIFKFSI